MLSIVLAGHPRLRNALMWPNMEEVGFRFAVFPFEGMAGHQAGYIAWLLERCLRDGADPAGVIEADAVELLAASASARSRRPWSRRCCRASSTTWSHG